MTEPVTYTHPSVLTTGIDEGWADPETDPARIDWAPRLARAEAHGVPFTLVDGRPLNPAAPTPVRYGRNQLGQWGPNEMADAIVTVTDGTTRFLLMIERRDNGTIAVPGGGVDDGENRVRAAARELWEETGLVLPVGIFRALPARHVPDERESDEAWAYTHPCLADLGQADGLPRVSGGDDARRALWVPACCYPCLLDELRATEAGELFTAHRDLLRGVLGTCWKHLVPDPHVTR